MKHDGAGSPRRVGRLMCSLVAVAVIVLSGGISPVRAQQAPQQRSSGLNDVAVVSDAGGPMTEIVIHYSADMVTDLAPTYRDLFAALPDDIRIQVLCASGADATDFAETWGDAASAGGRHLQVIVVDLPITVWARDRQIARQSASDTGVAERFVPADNPAYTDDKRNELLLPGLLAGSGLMPTATNGPLQLEGGNIVSNHRHAFIGANAIEENRHLDCSEADLLAWLEYIAGREVILVGTPEVPFCHVDMYLTPIDERTVAVGSTALAEELIASAPASFWTNLPQCVDIDRDDSVETATVLDEIAEQVARRGYRVVRVPAVIDGGQAWMVTYNNVLIEYRRDKPVIYMPIYHIPRLDHAAEKVYASLGFEVRTIDVSKIYELGGTVRCLVNVTERLPAKRTTTRVVQRRKGELQILPHIPHGAG